MDGKWTPGPWVVTKDGKNVCGKPDNDGMKPSVARYTNDDSHLIAAAPDLYEALDNLLRVHECDGGTKYHAGDIARAALAKARGE